MFPHALRAGSQSALDQTIQLEEPSADLASTLCNSEVKDSQADVLSETLKLRVGDEVGRYLLLSSLGVGGMGVVFRAYDPALDRKVAIKFVQAPQSGDSSNNLSHSESRSRLLQEAQYMAQLGHPNVVTIFDVGEIRSHVYLAMELIEGQTLKHWIRNDDYKWQQVVDIFIRAGKGLAAAHDLGLVHRDFKPDNVLLGTDGRVCVADFGLVYNEKHSPTSLTATATAKILQSTSTQTKLIIGTPFYMSPEQHQCAPATPLSDQFSFCICLYEAIYGIRPFFGRTLKEISEAIEKGLFTEPSEPRKVPSWLRRIVMRGLSLDPENRYPSMHMLLAELESKRRTSRGKFLQIGMAGLCMIGIVAGHELSRSENAESCESKAYQMQTTWNKGARSEVRSKFSEAGVAYAESSWKTLDHLLRERTIAWKDAYTELCEAPATPFEYTESDRYLMLHCLHDQLEQTETFVELLKHADATAIEKSVSSANSLNSIAFCQDLESLKRRIPLPTQPLLRSQILEIRQELDRARVLRSIGKLSASNDLAHRLIQRAEKSRYKPVMVEVYLALAEFHSADFEDQVASQWLKKASQFAEAHADDASIATLENLNLFVNGYRLGRTKGIEDHISHAHAHLLRAGNPPLIRAKWLASAGAVYGFNNRIQKAESVFRESLELYERYLGPGDEKTLIAYNDLAVTLTFLKQFDEAKHLYLRLLAIGNSTLGETHPALMLPLRNLSLLLISTGEFEDSIQFAEKSIGISETTNGKKQANSYPAYAMKSHVLFAAGRYTECAQQWQFIIDIFGDPPEQPIELVLSYIELARVNIRLGQFAKAQDALAKIDLNRIPPIHLQVKLHAFTVMIENALAQGQVADAIQLSDQLEQFNINENLQPLPNPAATAIVLGDLELARNHPQLAHQYHLQAYNIGLEDFQDPNNINLVPHLMALARSSRVNSKTPHTALQWNQQAIDNILKSPNDFRQWLSMAYLQRAKIYSQSTMWSQALESAQLARRHQVPEEMDSRVLVEIANTIARAQRMCGSICRDNVRQ